MTTTIIGLILMIAAFVLYFMEQRLCFKITDKTKGKSGALTITESWLNTRQFVKRKKLSALSKSSESEEVRAYARKALRFEMYFYFFFISGIMFFAFGS